MNEQKSRKPTDYELRMQYQQSRILRAYVSKYCVKYGKSLDETIRDMITEKEDKR